MYANLLKNWQDMTYCELPIPEIGAGEALVRMKYAGVCGSDITVYDGKHMTATAPVVLGHEILGTIERISPDSDFAPGERVTAYPLISCGECYACKAGMSHVCRELKLLGIHVNGGYEQYVKIPTDMLVRVPDRLPDKLAALAEPFAVGAHSTARAGVTKGSRVLVIGAGPIGVIIALCAKQRGGEVYIAEINEKRAALARSLGIDCLEIGKNQLDECLRVTDGCGFDAVIEASGSKAGILLTTDACKIGGTIVPMSLSGAPIEFVLGKVSFKEQTVVGSRVYTFAHFVEGVEMLDTIAAKQNIENLVSDILPLSEANRAIEMMKRGENAAKILIDCD